MEYQIGNLPPVVRSDGPFEELYTIPIDTLAAGDYGFHVRTVDELGLIGQSGSLPLRINEVRPPAPTATPDAALVAAAAEAQQIAEAPTQADAAEAQDNASKAQAEAAAAAAAAAAAMRKPPATLKPPASCRPTWKPPAPCSSGSPG